MCPTLDLHGGDKTTFFYELPRLLTAPFIDMMNMNVISVKDTSILDKNTNLEVNYY